MKSIANALLRAALIATLILSTVPALADEPAPDPNAALDQLLKLDPAALAVWLDPTSGSGDLGSLMRPSPPATLVRYRVSPLVNSARNEGPACVEPFEEPRTGQGFLPLD